MKLSTEDSRKLERFGINQDAVETQVQQLQKGSPQLDVARPCTIGDGIIRLTDEEKNSYERNYSQLIHGKKVIRFTPASGAATRMFKHLFNPEEHPKLVSEFVGNFRK